MLSIEVLTVGDASDVSPAALAIASTELRPYSPGVKLRGWRMGSGDSAGRLPAAAAASPSASQAGRCALAASCEGRLLQPSATGPAGRAVLLLAGQCVGRWLLLLALSLLQGALAGEGSTVALSCPGTGSWLSDASLCAPSASAFIART